jgi:hypothetical protein
MGWRNGAVGSAGVAFASPSNVVEVGDVASEGAAVTALRSDAVLAFPAESVEDVIGGRLTDTSHLDFAYDDATGLVTATIKASAVESTQLAANSVDNSKVAAGAALSMSKLAFRGARAHQQTAHAIAHDTWTMLTLDDETLDSNALHSPTVNPSRILLDTIGYWLVVGQVSIVANVTGRRGAAIFLNGSQRGYQFAPNLGAGSAVVVQVHDLIRATAVTDYVQLGAYQDSGVALNSVAGSNVSWLAALLVAA